MAKKKYYSNHPKLNLRVNDKMQRIPEDSPISLDEKAGKRLVERGLLRENEEKEVINAGDNEEKTPPTPAK